MVPTQGRASQPEAAGRSPRRSRRLGGALLLAIAAVVAVQAYWIVRDVHPLLHGDSYAYLGNLHEFLTHVDLAAPADAWQRLGRLTHGGRPPLYQLLTTPFVLLAPRSEDAPVFVNLVLVALLMLSTYAAGTATLDGRAGLLSALLVATYGPVFRISRQYLPYLGLVTASAVALWLLVLVVRDRSIRAAWGLGAASAAGVLIHPRYLHVMALPIVVLCVYTWLRPNAAADGAKTRRRLLGSLGDRFFLLGLLPAGVFAVLAAAGWYLTWGRRAIELGGTLQSGWLAQFRGYERVTIGYSDVPATFAWYARTSPAALSSVLVLLMVVGLVAALVRSRRPTAVHVVVLVIGYVVHGVDRTLNWSYAAALLPAGAIVTAVWLVELRRPWLRRALVLSCLVVVAFHVAVMTWDLPPWGRSVLGVLQLPMETADPPRNALGPAAARTVFHDWPVAELIDAVARDLAASGRRDALVMVVRDARLEGARLAYYLRRDHPALEVRAASEGMAAWGNPYNLGALLWADYVLFPTRPSGGVETLYPEASVRFLTSPPARFRDSHAVLLEVEIRGGSPVKLLKRTAPLTAAEAEEALAALELPDKYKSAGEVVARLKAAEKRVTGRPPPV